MGRERAKACASPPSLSSSEKTEPMPRAWPGLHLRLFLGGAAGVENLLDLGTLREELDELAGVLLLAFQAQGQGLHVLQQTEESIGGSSAPLTS